MRWLEVNVFLWKYVYILILFFILLVYVCTYECFIFRVVVEAFLFKFLMASSPILFFFSHFLTIFVKIEYCVLKM